MVKVSCIIIGKDEINDLPNALNSVINVCDEVIYVDTGSTDGTKEKVLKEFPTVKVFTYPWNGSFADARNFSLSKVKKTNSHVLYIDADEILHMTTPDGKFPDTMPEGLFNMDIRNMTDENNGTGFVNSVCSRVASNVKGLKFIGDVHEIFASTKKNLPILKFNYGYIDHYGYKAEYRKAKKKSERNIELLEKEYKKKPSVGGNFYLGQEYFILNKFEKTRDLALEGISLIDPNNALDKTFEPLILHALISSYISLNDEEGIKDFESKYLELANNPEVYQSLQNYYLNCHDTGKAIHYAFQTLKYTNAAQLPPKFIEKNIRYTPYINLAQYFMNVKQDKLMALYWLEMVHQAGVNDIKLLVDIYNMLPKSERTLDKWEYYNRQIYQQNKDERLLKDLIGCYLLSQDENKNKVAMSLANDLLNDDERQQLRGNLIQIHKEHLVELLK